MGWQTSATHENFFGFYNIPEIGAETIKCQLLKLLSRLLILDSFQAFSEDFKSISLTPRGACKVSCTGKREKHIN